MYHDLLLKLYISGRNIWAWDLEPDNRQTNTIFSGDLFRILKLIL